MVAVGPNVGAGMSQLIKSNILDVFVTGKRTAASGGSGSHPWWVELNKKNAIGNIPLCVYYTFEAFFPEGTLVSWA